MIAIVDYGAGNLVSVKKAFDQLGAESRITSDPAEVERASSIVLPGVGHFAATRELDRRGLRSPMQQAIARGVPFLGICVGMQWMFAGSDEAPEVPGLGLFPGMCARFAGAVKVPHVGWNNVRCIAASRLLRDAADEPFVYYTHSYRVPLGPATVAQSEYAGAFSAVVERGNAFGVQFHPEKSGATGLDMLRSFCQIGVKPSC